MNRVPLPSARVPFSKVTAPKRAGRRSASQAGRQEEKPRVPEDPKILDLTGRAADLRLPISTQLQVLNLSENASLSVDFVFALEAPALHTLRLNHCQISELPETPAVFCNTLRILTLDGNDIAKVPEWVLTMPELQELSLFGNCLTSIELPAMTHMVQTINLSYNPLSSVTGHGGAQVQCLNLSHTLMRGLPDRQAVSVCNLVLSKCKIEGVVDFDLSEDLTVLDLGWNSITGVTENFWASCGKLTAINLCGNQIESLPDNFPESNHMVRLNLSRNGLTELPETLMDLKSLETLNVSRNRIQKIAPFKYPRIREFIVSFNELTELADSFDSCAYLNILNVSSNKLSDLPMSLTSCRKVSELLCDSNAFDHIPKAIMGFGSIRTIVLSNNRLTTIDDSVEVFYLLKVLNLSNNHLTTVPSFISNFSDLRYLSLSHNRISNVDGIVWPAKLQALDLSFNLLESINQVDLPSLQSLCLQYNNLTTVQPLLNQSSIQFFSIAGNRVENGVIEISESCCAEIELFGNQKIEVTGRCSRARFTDNKTVLISSDTKFGVGIASSLGQRQTQEDSIVCICDGDASAFAVFDGHAGPTAANACAAYTAKNFTKFNVDSTSPVEMCEVITGEFALLNDELKAKLVQDGTTAAFAFVKGKYCYVVGIGDSRVVRVYADESKDCEQMTFDQKITDDTEFQRLKESGYVVSSDGRISHKLAVARSLGDFWCCEEGLFVAPDVTYFEITEADKGLIIACDGLWDTVDNHRACEIVRKAETATDAAITLKNVASGSGSADNISIIVVDFQPAAGDEGMTTRNTVKELEPYVPPKEAPRPATATRGRRRR